MVRKIIFIPLGIMLGAAAFGLAYPLLTGLPGSEQNVIPRFAHKWHVGMGAENQPTMQYLVRHQDAEFLAEIRFLEQEGDEQKVRLIIDDLKTNGHLDQTLRLGKAYVFVDVPQDVAPYVDHLDATVFSIRDTVVQDQYLVVGAEWGTTFVGAFTPKLKLTHYENTEFEFGSLKSFIVSYKFNDIENRLWIVDGLPLPVRAEYYAVDGSPDYTYDLVRLDGFAPSGN
ncbi:MAG: hypothetical protein LV468_02875 [Candidatus Nitrosotenuis sp.]|nr:hypothetical protein [Candidatus Nitrosotenuis sp.]